MTLPTITLRMAKATLARVDGGRYDTQADSTHAAAAPSEHHGDDDEGRHAAGRGDAQGLPHAEDPGEAGG